MRAFPRALKDLALGTLCATAWPLSVLAVGWTQALARRAVWRRLERAAGPTPPAGEAGGVDPDRRWILAGAREHRFAPLWRNLGEGLATTANTFALTLPPGALWLVGWHTGWNHSFHKSYELASVGPLATLLGVAVFVAIMIALPLAQVHQAVAGHWRAFYQFSLLRKLVAANAAGCARLALCYAAASIPVVALKTAPIAFDRFEGYDALSDAALRAQLESYFFWAGGLCFIAYTWLRTQAARVYADALLRAVTRGAIPRESLPPRLVGRLDRLALRQSRRPSGVAASLASGARGVGGIAMTAAAGLFWLAFAAQIFVSEFLHYHGPKGWLLQPLIQLPWFRYLPPGLG